MMLDLYGGTRSKLPNMLSQSMEDLEALLEIFIDDLQLGTGDAMDEKQWETARRNADSKTDPGFDQHLTALERVFARARTVNLRFKLSKCYFAQWEVETLGMIAGCGVIKADPKKATAIVAWPRPSREEDVERFLATTVFIREHLSPRYSEVAKPLRDCQAALHEARSQGKNRGGKAKFTPTAPGAPDDSWAPFWNEACERAFNQIKLMVQNAVDLSVPDFVGAGDGTNPFHLWPDACGYGVG